MTEPQRTPTALIILDGWGHREPADDNAISNANTPFWDSLLQRCPHTTIDTYGMHVGLPEGQMGNSEVGHMNLGAGRIVYQSLTRIDKEIQDGDFFRNPVLTTAVDKAVASGGAVHILGLLSQGGVHSHEAHIIAACQLASQRGARRVYVHAFLDGRDTPPRSAAPSLEVTQAALRELGTGRIASVVGRYFAMDRDKRWDRVEKAYHLLTLGEAPFRASTPQEALDAAYARGEDDEFVQATRVQADGEDDARIRDGDTVLFMNFRADRARELTHAFLDEPFNGFERRVRPQLAEFVMLTEYEAGIPAPIAYTTENLSNSIGEYLAGLGKTQLRIAETEKYAHVTFFFSGGREATFAGEERILVPSPQVATYDLKPEMSAPEVTDKLVEAIRSRRHDLVVVNYANGDMVGHTGKFSAAIQAAECLDTCLKRVTEALAEVGGQGLITADHGNLEQMDDPDSGQAHTQHTVGPVPLVYVGPRPVRLQSGGRLCDIAPSLLALMDLPQPAEMTGHSLIGAAD